MTQDAFDDKLTPIVDELSNFSSLKSAYHQCHEGIPFPSASCLAQVVDLCRSILFPGFFGSSLVSKSTISYKIGVSVEKLHHLLLEQVFAGLCFNGVNCNSKLEALRKQALQIVEDFIQSLPSMRKDLMTDVEAAYLGDPAAKDYSEIILCYPCIRAISNYRIAHKLLVLGTPLIPRMISEMAHSETGIDIHPGATIGQYFTIDHGTGVVIGETAIIGNHVKLYQGVTLGAKSFQLDEDGNPIKNLPRHPIVEDGVICYSNASVLGRITIGANAVIGGNVWVTHDVPAGDKVLQSSSKH